MVGKRIQAIGNSKHAGQTGVVFKDYGTMLLIKADDESYVNSYKSFGREGKYFQVDNLLVKQLKE